MNEAVVRALADDTSADLGAGAVGLYQFVWQLNSDAPNLPRNEFVDHARAALDLVMATEDVVLVWLLWDDRTFEEEAGLGALDDPRVWDDPTEKPYLAVMLRHDRGSRSALK